MKKKTATKLNQNKISSNEYINGQQKQTKTEKKNLKLSQRADEPV